MHTTKELLHEVKKKRGLRTDTALARELGVTKMFVSYLLSGKRLLSERLGVKVAEILGFEPEYVLRCIYAERAERSKLQLEKALEKAVKKLAAGVGALLVAGGLGALLALAPQPSQAAAPSDGSGGPDRVIGHYVKRGRRLARKAAQALAAIARTLAYPQTLLAPFSSAALGAL
jgi:transcriptional regulator with XRE-family HTH domain